MYIIELRIKTQNLSQINENERTASARNVVFFYNCNFNSSLSKISPVEKVSCFSPFEIKTCRCSVILSFEIQSSTE